MTVKYVIGDYGSMSKKNQSLLIKIGAVAVVLLFIGTAVTAMVFN